MTSGRPALDDLGILDLVDAVVLSFEVGMVEPDPRIFRLVEDALGLDPAECLMIGDSPTVDGAAGRAGMSALVVPTGVDGPRPDAVGALCGSGRRSSP